MSVKKWFPQRRPVAIHTEDGDPVVVVPGKPRPEAVLLNPTAMALWELCDGATTVDEMVQAVCDLFAVDPVRARLDVESALDDLRASGLIT